MVVNELGFVQNTFVGIPFPKTNYAINKASFPTFVKQKIEKRGKKFFGGGRNGFMEISADLRLQAEESSGSGRRDSIGTASGFH